ncbi:response regulator [Paenibacillus solisilvae]|uniref:Response regulator n=1 Tax=Paenibacillus solisilvae TaxID=2486751 RepID=A0ABW0W898_9BACL
MLTILLVEDEMIELNLMRNHIDWAGMGIEVVGTAKNGKKAWEQIQVLQPDIVLSDVRMPFMDGLQLASLIQERYDWIKVVFLSGHDEFTYVKSALQSGAVGYLLKPIDRNELSSVMAKVKEEVEKAKLLRRSKQVLIESHTLNLLTVKESVSREQVWLELVSMAPKYAAMKFVTALISVDSHPAIRTIQSQQRLDDISRTADVIQALLHDFAAEGTLLRLNEQEWLVVLQYEEGADYEALWLALSDAIKAAFAATVTIGVSDARHSLQHGRVMFEAAKNAVNERFFIGPGHIVHSAKLHDRLDLGFKAEYEGLLKRIDLSDRQQATLDIHHFFDLLTRLRVTKELVYEVTVELLKAITSELAKYEDRSIAAIGELSDWTQKVEGAEYIGDIKDFILDLTDKIIAYQEGRQQDRHLLLVQKVIDIIESEYYESLTIEYLAGQVYLSPNYLRVLFKEKKGCTIHEYLTRIRLNKSVELLHDKTLKIHDIARKVGYENTSYFCSFFYKTQGVTPNEYRKKFL